MSESLHSPYAQELLYEFNHSLLVAAVVNATLLGVYVTLATMAMYRLYCIETLPRRTLRMLVTFAVVSGFCYVGFVAGVTGVTRSILFEHGRNRVFDEACVSTLIVSLVVAGTLSDALLTYRCWIIWERSRWVCVPVLLLLAEFICFLVQDIQLSIAHIAWNASSARTALAGLGLNLALNVLLALAAVARLLSARKHRAGKHYVEIARLLAAIALAYVAAWAFTLVYRATFAAIVVAVVLISVVTLSPLLIALQVGERARAQALETTLELPEMMMPTSRQHSLELPAGRPWLAPRLHTIW
ncbi:hypothetical protein AURDEDRAFT_167195 [Auricularia subglabra TFB-10046 SS5]|nr:hypothetical protein AURDEDRAFT_167195 [Auricularia subglabra TFB-10046 SS5]